jgi:hypothetical protein
MQQFTKENSMADFKDTIKIEGFVEWAKVFPENKDDKEFFKSHDGMYRVNFYPKTEADMEEFISRAGSKIMGHDRIKIGNTELGMDGRYIELKRKHTHQFENLGGAPAVFDFTNGPSTKRWSFADDGPIGNGSECTAKLTITKKGSIVFIDFHALAVVNNVEYSGDGESTFVDPRSEF